MLLLPRFVRDQMVAHCLDGYPLEACGLLAGPSGSSGDQAVTHCFPTANEASSARVYTVAPRDMLRADREAEALGAELVGVYHSHTHTDAKPSPTDVAAAPDPGWHYVLVSLRDLHPVVRSWRIRDGLMEEEPVVLQ